MKLPTCRAAPPRIFGTSHHSISVFLYFPHMQIVTMQHLTEGFSLSAELNAPQQSNGATFDAPDNSAGKGSRQVKGARLILKQFHALLVKRFHHAVRSQKDFVAQVQRSTSWSR